MFSFFGSNDKSSSGSGGEADNSSHSMPLNSDIDHELKAMKHEEFKNEAKEVMDDVNAPMDKRSEAFWVTATEAARQSKSEVLSGAKPDLSMIGDQLRTESQSMPQKRTE